MSREINQFNERYIAALSLRRLQSPEEDTVNVLCGAWGRVSATTSPRVLRAFPDRETELAWRRFLDTIELPSHFVAPEYLLEPLEAGQQPFVILAMEAGAVVGVLSGYRDGRHVTCGIAPRPQLAVVAGPGRAAAEEALGRGLDQEAAGCRLAEVFSWEPVDGLARHGFRVQVGGDTNMLEGLQRSDEDLFRNFSETLRRYLRQGPRKGLEIVEYQNDDDLGQVVAIFNETHDRIGISRKTEGDWRRSLALTRNRRLFLARVKGEIIAATVVRFQAGGLAEYSENGSFARLRSEYHPNEALLWTAMRWCRSQGCQAFSFGGTNHFKGRFGGRVIPIYRHRRDQTIFRRIDRVEAIREGTRRFVQAWRSRAADHGRRAAL